MSSIKLFAYEMMDRELVGQLIITLLQLKTSLLILLQLTEILLDVSSFFGPGVLACATRLLLFTHFGETPVTEINFHQIYWHN